MNGPARERLYFDWAATAPLRPEAKAALLEALGDDYGNASSAHAFGRHARAALQRARRTFADSLGVARDDLFFVGNGSEANLVALDGSVSALSRDRRHLLVSAIEHPSVLEPLERAARSGAIELETLPVDRFGRVAAEELARRLRPTTGLVSVQLVNHEIGTVQPVAALAALAHGHGALFHCDATQAAGKLDLALPDLGVDLLVLSPHKFGGPRGVGVLARRAGVELPTPLSPGRQEQGVRGGTEDVATSVAAAVAWQSARTELHALAARLRELSALLVARLRELLPDVTLHSSTEYGVPGLVNCSFAELRGDWLVAALDALEVAVSHGSACSTRAALPSPVLSAIGAADHSTRSLRFSMGRTTTRADVEELARRLHAAVVSLRSR